MPQVQFASVVIPEDGTTSNSIHIPNYLDDNGINLHGDSRLFAIETPAALTGTSFGVQVSTNGGVSYKTMRVDGAAYALTVEADGYYPVDPATFAAVTNLKLVSNAEEAAARTITLILRAV